MKGEYGASINKNFRVIDTIGVPHLYCIGSKHMSVNQTMVLDIPECERRGAHCEICKKLFKQGKIDHILSYDEHKQALLVECQQEIQPMPQELKDYLLSIKEECEKNGYAGFAFIKSRNLGRRI